VCSHHRNDHTHTTPKRPPAPAMPPAAKNVAPAKGGKLNVLHGSAKVPDCPAVEVGGIAKDQVQVQDQGHDKEVLPNREFAEMRASAKVTPSFSILDGPNLNPNPNPHSLSWMALTLTLTLTLILYLGSLSSIFTQNTQLTHSFHIHPFRSTSSSPLKRQSSRSQTRPLNALIFNGALAL